LVTRDLAKVETAGSSPVYRSLKKRPAEAERFSDLNQNRLGGSDFTATKVLSLEEELFFGGGL